MEEGKMQKQKYFRYRSLFSYTVNTRLAFLPISLSNVTWVIESVIRNSAIEDEMFQLPNQLIFHDMHDFYQICLPYFLLVKQLTMQPYLDHKLPGCLQMWEWCGSGFFVIFLSPLHTRILLLPLDVLKISQLLGAQISECLISAHRVVSKGKQERRATI